MKTERESTTDPRPLPKREERSYPQPLPKREGSVVYTVLDSPVGEITVTSDGESITRVLLPSTAGRPVATDGWLRDDQAPPLAEACRQLAEYFAGTRRAFELPLAQPGTDFQRRVWEELTKIPYGETTTYGEIARRIGQPAASRAVGMANHCNSIAIVVPCHRVVGSSGKLVGYASGLPRKQTLLALEARATAH